jgi:hypothetical protein
MMVSSSLDPENLIRGQRDCSLGRGHGTRSLGPSDTSDSGSDLVGAPGYAQQKGRNLKTGTKFDPDKSTARNTAGPDVGDDDLDSDTDSGGTGERATASADAYIIDGADIDADRIETIATDQFDEANFEEFEAGDLEAYDPIDERERRFTKRDKY